MRFTYYANEIKLAYIRVELSTISLIYATADEVDSNWQMRVELRVQYSCVTLPWNPNFTIQLVGTVQNEGNFIQYSGYSYNC